MDYPLEVAERIKVLDDYTTSDDLEHFDILHLYDRGLAYPDGYYNARWFELVGYHSDMHLKRYLGRHDGLDLKSCKTPLCWSQIFADGAFLLRFQKPITVEWMWQAAVVKST